MVKDFSPNHASFGIWAHSLPPYIQHLIHLTTAITLRLGCIDSATSNTDVTLLKDCIKSVQTGYTSCGGSVAKAL